MGMSKYLMNYGWILPKLDVGASLLQNPAVFSHLFIIHGTSIEAITPRNAIFYFICLNMDYPPLKDSFDILLLCSHSSVVTIIIVINANIITIP